MSILERVAARMRATAPNAWIASNAGWAASWARGDAVELAGGLVQAGLGQAFRRLDPTQLREAVEVFVAVGLESTPGQDPSAELRATAEAFSAERVPAVAALCWLCELKAPIVYGDSRAPRNHNHFSAANALLGFASTARAAKLLDAGRALHLVDAAEQHLERIETGEVRALISRAIALYRAEFVAELENPEPELLERAVSAARLAVCELTDEHAFRAAIAGAELLAKSGKPREAIDLLQVARTRPGADAYDFMLSQRVAVLEFAHGVRGAARGRNPSRYLDAVVAQGVLPGGEFHTALSRASEAPGAEILQQASRLMALDATSPIDEPERFQLLLSECEADTRAEPWRSQVVELARIRLQMLTAPDQAFEAFGAYYRQQSSAGEGVTIEDRLDMLEALATAWFRRPRELSQSDDLRLLDCVGCGRSAARARRNGGVAGWTRAATGTSNSTPVLACVR